MDDRIDITDRAMLAAVACLMAGMALVCCIPAAMEGLDIFTVAGALVGVGSAIMAAVLMYTAIRGRH